MSKDEQSRRRSLTFLEAEGLETLPAQLSGHEVTQTTKVTLLWFLSNIDGGYGDTTLLPIWIHIFGLYHDELPQSTNERLEELKEYIDNGTGAEILNLIQFLARSEFIGSQGFNVLVLLCEEQRLAYRLSGTYKSTTDVPTLFPISSPEQSRALQEDLDSLALLQNGGTRKHLVSAASALNSGDFAGSVRESIHAVESTAKSVTGNAKADLNGAMKILEAEKPLHPALRQALEKLYAWTSDEKGIRHALIDADSNVTEAQAIFMLSACAAFSAWLAREATV